MIRRSFFAGLLSFISLFLLCAIIYTPTVEERIDSKNVMMFAVQHSMIVGIVLVIYVSIIQSYLSTKNIKKFYLNLKEISRIYSKDFRTFVDFDDFRKAACRKIFTVLTFLFAAQTFVGYHYLKPTPISIVSFIISTAPLLFLLMVALKFILHVEMVNYLLKLLEELIIQIFKATSRNNLLESDSHGPSKFNKDTMKKLRAARQTYNLIYESGNLVNKSNGLTILIMLISITITITQKGYEIFVIVVSSQLREQFAGNY